jgi:hypothetical protein
MTADPDAEPPPPSGVAWTTAVIAIAAVALLLINAPSVRSWTAQLPPGEAALEARDLADRWAAATARLGLNAPRAALAGAWDRLLAARFGGTPPPPGRAPATDQR